jgi:hypothetical protein
MFDWRPFLFGGLASSVAELGKFYYFQKTETRSKRSVELIVVEIWSPSPSSSQTVTTKAAKLNSTVGVL